jgi:hypothetical protein
MSTRFRSISAMTTDTPLPEDAAQPAAGEPTAAELNP